MALTESFLEKPQRLAWIDVASKHLLDQFDFQGGRILQVGIDRYGIISFLIEHPDMPEVQVGDALAHLNPIYQMIQEGAVTKTERIDQPKKKQDANF